MNYRIALFLLPLSFAAAQTAAPPRRDRTIRRTCLKVAIPAINQAPPVRKVSELGQITIVSKPTSWDKHPISCGRNWASPARMSDVSMAFAGRAT